MRIAILAAAAMLTMPAMAQDDPAYTPRDAELMETCLTGTEAQAGDAGTGTASLADCIGAASNPCMDTAEGMTTIGMSQCMGRETNWWDNKLNAHYAELRDSLDAESFAALQEAQRNWIAFRDADCRFQYTAWRGGTIRSTFHSSCMLDATAHRALDLAGYAGWNDR